MTNTPRRRMTDRVGASPTIVGVGAHFTGDLECGDLVVGGSMRGDAQVNGSFTLSEGARWEGEVRATQAVIAGEVEGVVTVSEKLEIRKTARVRGAVRARSIAVARGAVVEGEMVVTSGESVMHFEEKRAG